MYAKEQNFDWRKNYYEILEIDKKFLKESNLNISDEDFEKVIDIFEMLAVSGRDQSMKTLTEKFYGKVNNKVGERIDKQILERIWQYWKPEKEKRKYKSFLRMFWENPDYYESDNFCAFRKPMKDDKIKTRFNPRRAEDKL